MIHQLNIIARIAPHPTHYNKAREAICEIIEQTRAEPGCMEFRLSENAQDGTLYCQSAFNRDPLSACKRDPSAVVRIG